MRHRSFPAHFSHRFFLSIRTHIDTQPAMNLTLPEQCTQTQPCSSSHLLQPTPRRIFQRPAPLVLPPLGMAKSFPMTQSALTDRSPLSPLPPYAITSAHKFPQSPQSAPLPDRTMSEFPFPSPSPDPPSAAKQSNGDAKQRIVQEIQDAYRPKSPFKTFMTCSAYTMFCAF
jgi:hypothetical protein